MINTTVAYKKALEGSREFRIRDKITFKDGTTLQLSILDFMEYRISEATSDSGKFEIGAAVIKEYSAALNNEDGKFDSYNFEGADLKAVVGLRLADGSWEDLDKGLYRIVSAKASELTIKITAYDSMLFFDTPYSESSLTYPATITQIIQDACKAAQVTFDASTVEMGSYRVKERPKDDTLTYRDIISYCAQVMGCYAKINRLDRIVFGWYPFGNTETVHRLYKIKDQSINTDDITITGIKVCADTENEESAENVLYGKEGYVLEISENPLIQAGAVEAVAEHVGKKITGNTFRPLSISCQSDPSMEAGDAANVTDWKQRDYRTVITNTTFSLGGIQKVECSAETPTEKNYVKYGSGTKLLAKAQNDAKAQLSAYDIAVQNINQLAANTFGFYATTIQQSDGSMVSYRHDKPTLEGSKTVYKSGIDGFFVTKDYQGTDEATTAADKWKAGFDSSGNAAANILSVIGINFDWAHGGTLTLGGNGNKNGELRILDDSGKEVGRINNTGADIVGTFLSRLGSEWMKIKESVLTGGYVGVTDGLLDLSAQYDDGTRNVVLEAITGETIIKSRKGVRIGKETSTSRDVCITDARMSGVYGDETEGLLDLSALHSDGRHVVLESKNGKVIINSKKGIVLDGLELKNGDSGTYDIKTIKSITVTNGIITNVELGNIPVG